MSEATGEAAVLTKLRSVTGFSSTNTAHANWKLLNSGKSDHYGIVKSGPFERSAIGLSTYDSVFSTVIEVWQRYKDDADSNTSLRTYVDSIIAYFDQYRKLGNTVLDSIIAEGGEVEEMWREKDDGPSWLKRDLVVRWVEYSDVTFAE